MTSAMLTNIERRAIQGIIDSDFRDGNHPVDHLVWTWSANPFPNNNKRTFASAIASLVRKGYVKTDAAFGHRDDCLTLTQAGYDAYMAE
jgi:hypothetical protein